MSQIVSFLAKYALTHAGETLRNELKLAGAEAAEALDDVAAAGGLAVIASSAGGASFLMSLLALSDLVAGKKDEWAPKALAASVGWVAFGALSAAARQRMAEAPIDMPRTREHLSRLADPDDQAETA
jgi:hypothetical protein